MSDLEKYKACLITFGEALKHIITEARTYKKTSEKNEFDTGYLCGLHRIITLLQQQAEIYNISLKEISLEGIKDTDLI